MELKEIKELIELVAEKRFAEFELQKGSFRLRLSLSNYQLEQHEESSSSKSVEPSTVSTVSTTTEAKPQPPPVQIQKEQKPAQDLHKIKAPIVGTFYRAANPTAEPFVKVGSKIRPGSVLCIIEAMKLMNEIEADVAGEVVEIFVENGHAVEYGQPLFSIKAD